ncbi:MAG: type IV secretory system conjugative DNA transfer family protein [Paracoccaceae bacterium]
MSGYRDLPRGTLHTQEGDSPLATGRWATPDEIAEMAYKPGDLLLGTLPVPSTEAAIRIEELREQQALIAIDTARDPDLRSAEIDALEDEIVALSETDLLEIGIDDDRHHLLVAGTRAGKTTTVLIPNLLRYPGSVIATDPKGQLASSTALHRAKPTKEGGLGQRVLVMDPYGTSKLPKDQHATWNPLDLIDEQDDEALDKAAGIAEALTVRTNTENAHFDDSSRMWLKGLILFTAERHNGKATRTLITVYDYLMRGAPLERQRNVDSIPDAGDLTPFQYLLEMMRRSDAFDGVVAGAAESLLTMGDRERGSVLSTARRSMEFLERRPMRRLFASSSFNIDDLKTDPKGVSLYLCLPPQRMHDCGRFLRMMISSVLERMYEIEEEPATGHPVLAMLEEFPVLGHMPLIEQAAGYAAGFGLKLMIVIQDLTQLQRHYREGWETFIGNAGCIQAFANNDLTTLEYLSKKLGECEITQTTHNISTSTALSTNDPSAQAQMQGLMSDRGEAAILANPLALLADPATAGTSTTTTESWNMQDVKVGLLDPEAIARVFARSSRQQILLKSGERAAIVGRMHVRAEENSHPYELGCIASGQDQINNGPLKQS